MDQEVADFILKFESGEISDEEMIHGFQELIDSGIAWKLQGCYGMMADVLIKEGYCKRKDR